MMQSTLFRNVVRRASFALSAGLVAVCAVACVLHAQSAPASASSAPAKSAPAPAGQPSRYTPNRPPRREVAYYATLWGADSFTVKYAESGELIRFSYRILDPERAATLNDKKNEAFLICPSCGVKLTIPSLEKVGQLRQSSTPIAGTTYWMAFSNSGRRVRPGDHVAIQIGKFHVDNLIVQ